MVLPIKIKSTRNIKKAITPPEVPLNGGVVIFVVSVKLEYCGTLII
jgi:hypothetical protein